MVNKNLSLDFICQSAYVDKALWYMVLFPNPVFYSYSSQQWLPMRITWEIFSLSETT